MARQNGTNQCKLFFFSLDDQIRSDQPGLAIDAFVYSLDWCALILQKAQAKHTGCPPLHPGDLLKLYIYRYLDKI